MSDNNSNQTPGMPTPNPMLEALDQFVGTWELKGHLVGSNDESIHGKATFEWLPGKFFLKQTISMHFMGMVIESTELVGFDGASNGLKSAVYSNMSPEALPYFWKVDDNKVEIKVNYGPLDATFHGEFSADGKHYNGGWRPNEGADTNVNVAYDLTGKRVN